MLGLDFRIGSRLFFTLALATETLGRQGIRESMQPTTQTQPAAGHDSDIQQFRERGNRRVIHVPGQLAIRLLGTPDLGICHSGSCSHVRDLARGEIIPKLYANRSQLSMVIFMAGPLTFLSHLFRPLSSLLIGSTSVIRKRMDKKDNLSIDQLSKALELTKDTAINEEKDILEGIVRFGNIDAVDIIRPRINVIAIDSNSTYQQVKEIITEHGYSRMPVYEENLDNITGILYVKDLLLHLDEKNDFRWQTLIRPAYFVPESKKINDLLEEFQSKKVHLAIVVDEYGGTSGIVTMEDIIEEIVGDINDEYDEQEIVYTRDKNGAFIFEASTLLNDFYKITDIDEDTFQEVEGDADTLAGLILELKGELPLKDEVITYKEHQFKILEVDNRRIKKIQYKKIGNTEVKTQN